MIHGLSLDEAFSLGVESTGSDGSVSVDIAEVNYNPELLDSLLGGQRPALPPKKPAACLNTQL